MGYIVEEIQAGAYLDGVQILQNDYKCSAKDKLNRYAPVRGLLSQLTAQEQNRMLDIVKITNLKRLSDVTQEKLKTIFEYPASSGNIIDLSNTQAAQIKCWYDITKLQISKGQISFPIFYVGTGTQNLEFADEAAVDAFFNAALATFTQYNTVNFGAVYNQINAITIANQGGLIQAIAAIEAIEYPA